MKTILGSVQRDGMYIIFPTLTGFAFLAIYVLLVEIGGLGFWPTGFVLIVIYSVLFDINHFFSTYTRTVFDKSFIQENQAWFISSALFIFFALLVFYMLACEFDHSYRGQLYLIFMRRFLLVLGFYHLVKQNWGFMAIYKQYAGEKPANINWELVALISGSFIALLVFSIQTPLWFPASEAHLYQPAKNLQAAVNQFWQDMIVLVLLASAMFAVISLSSKKFQFSAPAKSLSLYCLLVATLIASVMKFGYLSVMYTLLAVLIVVFSVSLYFSIQYQRKQGGLNGRKWALFTSSLVLYFGVLLYPVEGDSLVKIAAITLPHNIQYLAFVPTFSNRQYAKSKKNHGLAVWLTKRVSSFLLVGAAFGLVFEMGRTGSSYWLPTDWIVTKNLVVIFFASLVLHHYYLDAVIWKLRKHKELRESI